MIRLFRAAFAASLLLIAPAFAQDGEVHLGNLTISAPFSRATLPNAPVGGGFLSIENTGTDADRLVSASSPAAGAVQIHEMAMQGDVMKMRELGEGLEIPAGQTVVLAPGGFHLMFMGLKQAFVEGETVPVTLVFEKAGTVDVELSVQGVAADGAAMNHDAMKHDSAGHDAAGHGAMNHGAMNHDAMTAQPADDTAAITGMLKGVFETPDAPLSVEPVVVSGEYAIAGWSQGEAGGRALLRKTASGWAVHLCAGDGLKDAGNLAAIGVPAADADALAAALASAEAHLDPALLAKFASFDGTVMVDEDLI
ncbi:MAG: copper uptake system-associated protein [Alphaproteobacteria bacterium]|nr:copper uptake system-associated protein [Alphaproteobacteria bacterium]